MKIPKRTARYFYIGILTGVLAGGVGLLGLVGAIGNYVDREESLRAAAAQQLESRISGMDDRITGLAERLNALVNTPPGQLATDARIAELGASYATLDERLRDIENALLSDPTKALQVPLLARDVQSVERRLEDLSDNVDDDVDWVRNLLFGSMVVLATGLVSQTLELSRRGRQEEEK